MPTCACWAGRSRFDKWSPRAKRRADARHDRLDVQSPQPPYVSHFRGTEMVVEHIEKYWCPSITSVDFLGGEPFHFKEDSRQNVAMVIGENEYHTWETLPEFAKKEFEWRGIKYRLCDGIDQCRSE